MIPEFDGIEDLINSNIIMEDVGAKIGSDDAGIFKFKSNDLKDTLQKNQAMVLNLECQLKKAEKKIENLQEQLESVVILMMFKTILCIAE